MGQDEQEQELTHAVHRWLELSELVAPHRPGEVLFSPPGEHEVAEEEDGTEAEPGLLVGTRR